MKVDIQFSNHGQSTVTEIFFKLADIKGVVSENGK